MTKRQNVALGRFVALGVLLSAGYILNCLANAFSTWMLAESSSPTRVGVATILVDAGPFSFAGNTSYFFVRDTAKSGTTPLRVGGPYISDGPIKLQEAAWSKDGSIVAVRVKVGQSAGHGFSRYDGAFWIDAYDFRAHQAVLEGAKIRERSKVIEHLFAQRGGIGVRTLTAPSVVGRSVGWLEAQAFDTSNANYKDLR
jgi:hypothetical protein